MRRKPLKKTPKNQPSLVSRLVIACVLTAVMGVFILFSSTDKQPQKEAYKMLSAHSMSLEKRYSNSFVNNVFKDNILLNLAYLQGKQKTSHPSWDEVIKPTSFSLVLKPSETFAFHKDVLPQYQGKQIKAIDIHFSSDEGFKSDGYLVGDGVCHLASLINWAARDAKLYVVSPTNHDFAEIAEVPREYGVAIYNMPGESAVNAQQNLYVTNNKEKPITITFDYDGESLRVAIAEKS